MNEKPTSQSYYEKLFEITNLNGKDYTFYGNIHFTKKIFCRYKSSYVLYKILNNIFFLNKLLFKFKKVPSPLYSFCNSAYEMSLHIFYTCTITKPLWNKLQYFVSHFSHYLYIPEITPQSALLRFFNVGNQ